ncbi:transcription factor 19 isoform X5 [Equus asinus]|uniref:transcription factor 19 isoform X5 n=1 Tax=Equus asinus TaxID=9793 RepID=UPI0038F60090
MIWPIRNGTGAGSLGAKFGPGNSEGGVGAARARRPRPFWPRLPRCQTAAGAPAPAGARGVPGPPRGLALPGEEITPRLHRAEPGLISGVHAELHAERWGDDWRVSLEDHSSQGTLVNNVRLPRGHRLELSDGDLLTFGPEGPPGTSPSEFYFMFQQVRVKPQDFAAITIPRSRGEEGTGAGFRPMLPSQGAPQRPLSTLSPAPKATLILNSIGSLSKLQPQPLTFSRSGGGPQSLPVPTPPGEVGTTPSAPPPRNRRKSAHRVLAELDDEREAPESPPPVLMEPRKKLRVEKTPLTPSGRE